MGSALVILKFEGTLALPPSSEFYRTLLRDPFNPDLLELNSPTALQSRFSLEAQTTTDFLLSEQNIEAIRKLLQNPNLTLSIVTQYLAEYVRQLLRFQQFSQEELQRIHIYSGSSYHATQDAITAFNSPYSALYLVDNNEQERKEMILAGTRNNYRSRAMKTFELISAGFSPLFKDLNCTIPDHLWLKTQVTPIVSTASAVDSSYQDDDKLFGYYETKGPREAQEDCIVYYPLSSAELGQLTTQQIAERLWSALVQLDTNYYGDGGSTVSAVVFTGKELIVATLGDSNVFLVWADAQGQIISEPIRLNSINHNPNKDCPQEQKRIRAISPDWIYANTRLVKGKNTLAVSRSLGDHDFKPACCCFAAIDIIPLDIQQGRTALVTLACDGLTEKAKSQTKKGHENYVKQCLPNNIAHLNEEGLARTLVTQASMDGSGDNISVAVRSLSHSSLDQPFIMVIGDGHGDNLSFLLQKLPSVLTTFCQLPADVYAKHPASVYCHNEDFKRDNGQLGEFVQVSKMGIFASDSSQRQTGACPVELPKGFR